ncbi:translationally controlled tumor protein [Tricladium varicosporioides]|nr:translationally controlled tumor protein [Hymenoscyphus varicosporioides]
MIIYKDIITGDELMSDSYDLKEIDGTVYEINCDMITEGAVQVNTGANASAEEAEEAIEDGAVQVNNVVNSFRLQQTSFDKKQYLSHLKTYMKKVKEALKAKGAEESVITDFEKGAQAYAKKIVGGFKNYDFYIGESMDPDGMVILMNYREDGTTPYVTIWKHGLVAEKI